MSLATTYTEMFLQVDVATCNSLTANTLDATTLTLTNPLSFPDGNVRVGTNAGAVNQGTNSIAIGAQAAPLNQPNHSIVINATGNTVNASQANSLYIAPIRAANGTRVLFYDTITNEVTQATGGTSQVVAIQDNLGITHNMTFVAGVLVAYSTV